MQCTVRETKHEVPDKKVTNEAHRIIRIPVDVNVAAKLKLSKARAVQPWVVTVLCGVAMSLVLVQTTRFQKTELELVKRNMLDLLEELRLTRQELLTMQKDMVLLQVRVNQLKHGHRSKVKREVSVQSSSDVENVSSTAVNTPDNINCSLCLLGSRTKRSTRRGNHHSGKGQPSHRKNHQHKKNKIRGPMAVHFKGGLPERVIEDSGLVAPWFPDKNAITEFSLNNYTMREGKGTVEITECGLYWIYAQVYYLTSEHQNQNSFSINLRKAGEPSRTLATCSANSGTMKGTSEISCYTSVVRYLNVGDHIFVHQRERNRRVILRDSFSFFGLVRLNSLQGGRC